MTPTREGSFRLFRLAGIDVFLHWSWLLVAWYQISSRPREYSSPVWNVVEYLALFGIVLMHEFGHALACRQVGGRANEIVLWPLGGVAYVSPPPRPGAILWSIAAGPLVNVALVPVLLALLSVARSMGWPATSPDLYSLVRTVSIINLVLLVFNLLPVYPLDGGQILRSLLWFGMGRARSLKFASLIGFVGVAVLFAFAVQKHSLWIGIMAAFILLNCWRGWQEARAMTRMAEAPRHEGFACPACHATPPRLALWICGSCQKPFDMFATGAMCPHCKAQFEAMQCLECGAAHPISQWAVSPSAPPPLPQSS